MKHTLTWLACCLLIFSAKAQTRYLDDTYFSTVEVDTGILFGNNLTYENVSQDLYLDFYQPVGDTETERPLMIWIHGGGYSDGSRTDPHIERWCEEFARRGYVTASIDYRLGVTQNQYGKIQAIYRSVQDAKAAIRFFREHALEYGVDVDKIVIAGSSVGAFTAIHTAYWDTDELPASIDTLELGNLEGESGNPGYPSNPNAVINFWGAIKDTTWIDADEPMIVSCAGELDSVVYPGIHVWGSGPEYGSLVIDRVAKMQGIADTLRMFIDAKHTLAGGEPTDQSLRFDTATVFATEFLYCNLIQSCDLSVLKEKVPGDFSLYPNPTTGGLIVQMHSPVSGKILIYSALGAVVKDKIVSAAQEISLDLSGLENGVYYLAWGEQFRKIIKTD
jgi:hypothetical protein